MFRMMDYLRINKDKELYKLLNYIIIKLWLSIKTKVCLNENGREGNS